MCARQVERNIGQIEKLWTLEQRNETRYGNKARRVFYIGKRWIYGWNRKEQRMPLKIESRPLDSHGCAPV